MDLEDVFNKLGSEEQDVLAEAVVAALGNIAELMALSNIWVSLDDDRVAGKITAEEQVKMMSGAMFPTVVNSFKTMVKQPEIFDRSIEIEDQRRELAEKLLKSDLK